MISVQKYWHEPQRAKAEKTRHLHVVSATATPRPRWKPLYVALGVIGMAGVAAHLWIHGAVPLELADAGFAFALFVTLAGWTHLNRVTLACNDHAASQQPKVRIVRSRARAAEEAYAEDGVVRLTPDERVILPYDFK
jgi:hypothetical protein